MCGRYALLTPLDELTAALNATSDLQAAEVKPVYNAAPGQNLLVAYQHGRAIISQMKWGLVPSWSPSQASKGNTINAQQENVATKPTFRHLIQTNRCAVPITAFYEWKLANGVKQPYAIRPAGNTVWLAGLYDRWQSADGAEILTSFTILTTPSAGIMTKLHDRQPVVIADDQVLHWLDKQTAWPDLQPLLQSYPWEGWRSYPVSPLVNHVKHNMPSLLNEAPMIPVQGSLFG